MGKRKKDKAWPSKALYVLGLSIHLTACPPWWGLPVSCLISAFPLHSPLFESKVFVHILIYLLTSSTALRGSLDMFTSLTPIRRIVFNLEIPKCAKQPQNTFHVPSWGSFIFSNSQYGHFLDIV